MVTPEIRTGVDPFVVDCLGQLAHVQQRINQVDQALADNDLRPTKLEWKSQQILTHLHFVEAKGV